MQTINNRTGLDTRTGKPRAVKLELCGAHGYLTFARECSCSAPKLFTRYAVIGTAYGWLHSTGGDVRTWQSASGARHAVKNYVGI